jgi:hypothetical protein
MEVDRCRAALARCVHRSSPGWDSAPARSGGGIVPHPRVTAVRSESAIFAILMITKSFLDQ